MKLAETAVVEQGMYSRSRSGLRSRGVPQAGSEGAMKLYQKLLLAVLCTMLGICAYAEDPPGRVARMNYMSGQVSIQPVGQNDGVAANINRLLTSGDRV